MPLDAVMMGALAAELNAELRDARIDKIHMPKSGDVVLNLRGENGAKRLIIATTGGASRAHLTKLKQENPDTPPMFCMLLRKYLGAGRIVSITQPLHERIIKITLTATDEMGFIGEKYLICELMGRRSNIVLVDKSDLILACLKRVDTEMSPERPLSPGLIYRMPPKQDKCTLFEITHASGEQIFEDNMDGDAVLARVEGISPLLARELAFRAGGSKDKLVQEVLRLAQDALDKKLQPYMLMNGDKQIDFTAIEIAQYAGEIICKRGESYSQVIDDFYMDRTIVENQKNSTAVLEKTISNARNRVQKKLASQTRELLDASAREKLKATADLIMANLHTIKSGDRQAEVIDYFTEGMPVVKINLDGDLSPQQNAQKFFKKYSRLKNAEGALQAQLELGKQELDYLNSILYAIECAKNVADVEQIKQELVESGYIKNKTKSYKKVKKQSFTPRRFETSDGFAILCGKNNRENDELTMRQSQGKDLWFHVRNAPGSHVILQLRDNIEPSDSAIEQAAQIAAFYSSQSTRPKVPVDYTYVKSVKKPQGAKPGMVNYFNFKTITVVPKEGK